MKVRTSTCHRRRGASQSTRGFTMIEAAIALVIAGIAILITMAVVGNMAGVLRFQRAEAGGQDNIRVVADEIARQLRSAGSGADHSLGQTRFVHASSYTVGFNSNLTPTSDEMAAPVAIDPSLGDATVPLDLGDFYTPPRAFTTGAETIVITMDSDRDGTLSAADAGDDEDEQDTEDEADYLVSAFAYGSDGTANAVAPRGLGLARGPAAGDDSGASEPLFRYWIDSDNDPATGPVLHGDDDNDGVLSESEAAAAGAVPASDLPLVERVDISVTASRKASTAASLQPGHGGSQQTPLVLRSSVSFRNRNTTVGRIIGRVYNDADGDGAPDAGELPIRDVAVTCSNGQRTLTNADGRYQFVVNPGTYTIIEIDPARFTSTTPNTVTATATAGGYTEVDFGDRSGSGTGYIHGFVYSDDNRNAQRESGERGLSGIRLMLDTGVSTTTDLTGRFVFPVAVGFYVVAEEDSISYVSSTPNVVDANVAADRDSVRVDFGDYRLGASGTIHGIVYMDADNSATRDAGEAGIANVTITLEDGQIGTTDGNGEFRFTAPPGTIRVTETDLPGYTSSTVNTVYAAVVSNETVEVEFGDIAEEDIEFQEITLGNTERALSIGTYETGEDSRGDMDMVLGTHYVGGNNDILTWWNNRTSASTPNAGIFSTTPSYSRVVAADVNAVVTRDLNGDGRGDLISGLGSGSSNVAIWIMQTSGSNKGKLPTSPTAIYSTLGAIGVKDLAVGTCDTDAHADLVIGTYSSATTGKFEVWHGTGSGYSRGSTDVYGVLPDSGMGIGAIRAIALADFNGDGRSDIVVAGQTATNAGAVHLFVYDGVGIYDYNLRASIPVVGEVQDVLALDMREDNQNDVDIIIGVASGPSTGEVQVWHNRGDNTFGAGEFPSVTPHDTADPGGAPLSLSTLFVDNDVFPDLIVGTRSATYVGQAVVYRAFGFLPTNGMVISSSGVGEVITSTVADFNRDGASDVSVGTRTSGSTGKVVVYFNVRPAI